MITKTLLIPGEHPGAYRPMPEGLGGYWWETEQLICVPFVIAEHPGAGAFAAFLAELESKGKVVFFPTVIGARLSQILVARGYSRALARMSEEEQEVYGQIWVDGLGKDFRGVLP